MSKGVCLGTIVIVIINNDHCRIHIEVIKTNGEKRQQWTFIISNDIMMM